MKPRILLSISKRPNTSYIKAIEAVGGEPSAFYVPKLDPTYDALVLCGGADIDPSIYGQENTASVDIDHDRDSAEFELFDIEHREKCLLNFIESLSPKEDGSGYAHAFDFVMIDCPPSLSMLTVNALTASSGVVIPMQSEYYALEGLTQLMLTIKKVKQHYNPQLSILGILITMHNGRLNLSVQVLDELKKYYSDKLFKTMIPRAVKLSEAPGFGTPVMYHDKFNKGTKAYEEVAEEILSRIGIVV